MSEVRLHEGKDDTLVSTVELEARPCHADEQDGTQGNCECERQLDASDGRATSHCPERGRGQRHPTACASEGTDLSDDNKRNRATNCGEQRAGKCSNPRDRCGYASGEQRQNEKPRERDPRLSIGRAVAKHHA